MQLHFGRDALTIIVAQVVLAAGAIAMHLLYSRDMHDELPAKFRGGSASAVSTVEKLLLVPMSLAFGWLSTQHGVFTAAWIGVGLVITLAICELHPANTS